MKVRDIMTKHICCVSPDMTIENASKLMTGADIGVVPVCGSNGVCGILTDRDIIIRSVSKGLSPSEKVEKIMSSAVITTTPDSDIKDAVKLMSVHQIRRLPVISGHEIVGILSVGDLARCGRLDTEVAKAECGIAKA